MTIGITPNQSAAGPAAAPTFTVATTQPFCEVQLTTEPILFSGTLNERRRAGINFVSSGRLAASGRDRAVFTPGGATALLRSTYLYYRALGYETPALGQPTEASVADADYAQAPFVYLDPRPAPRPPSILSAKLPGLSVTGSDLSQTGSGPPVVLRGVNIAGVDTAKPGALDWNGQPQDAALDASGLSLILPTLVADWGVNLVRLPVSQRWVLERIGYLKDIDWAIGQAAAAGAYTLLAVDRFDVGRIHGEDDRGNANEFPPLPDENTVRMWSLLARRYAREPAVLYEVFGKPHEPLAKDPYPFPRPSTEAAWTDLWKVWARRLAATIQGWNPAAVILVSGWQWGLNLRRFPLGAPGIAGVLYAAHASAAATPGGSSDFAFWFGPAQLQPAAPVFVAEWGAQSGADIAWSRRLEAYLRQHHGHGGSEPGRGVAGWTAWSIPEPPPLLKMETRTRTIAGKTVRYRAPLRDAAGRTEPAPSGVVVRDALQRGLTADPGTVVGRAGDPITPMRARVIINRGVGDGESNLVTDVRTVQARLRELGYLQDNGAETPPVDAAGLVPVARLAGTIAAVRALQADAGLGVDGAASPGGRTNEALNRMIRRPANADFDAVRQSRTGIQVTVLTPGGAAISKPVGAVRDADVTSGKANTEADVSTVQARLVELSRLDDNHGEDPTADPQTRLAARMPKTLAAIRAFQQGENIAWWKAHLGKTMVDRVVQPGDATQAVLDGQRTYVLLMPEGPDVSVRNFQKSPYTINTGGIGYAGWADPSSVPFADYLAMGLDQAQSRALQFVSTAEGKFDALNTYDIARVSWGFIQFAGGRGLPPCLALAKWRSPQRFAELFQQFGVDVEYAPSDGEVDATRSSPMVLQPADNPLAPNAVFRGIAAENSIRDTPQLWSVFIAAGRDRDMQLAQLEAATRSYVLLPLTRLATWNSTSAPLRELLASEQGIAILIDRSVQEGATTGPIRVIGAMRFVAQAQQLAAIENIVSREREVLDQVSADMTADLAIRQAVNAAVVALGRLIQSCDAAGATVAGILASADAAIPATQLDLAIPQTDNKSLPTAIPGNSWLADPATLRASLQQQRIDLQLDAAHPPAATVATLKAYLEQHWTALGKLIEYSAGIGDVLNRVTRIRQSGLKGP